MTGLQVVVSKGFSFTSRDPKPSVSPKKHKVDKIMVQVEAEQLQNNKK